MAQAEKFRQILHKELNEEEKLLAESLARTYLSKFGPEALNRELYPIFSEAGSSNEIPKPKPIKKVAPKYPLEALRRGTIGSVIVEFDVAQDGTVRDPEVIEGMPRGVFDQKAIEAVLQFKYEPSVVDGKPVRYEDLRNKIAFAIAASDKDQAYRSINRYVKKYAELAEKGNPVGQYVYALAIDSLPGLDSDSRQVTEMLTKSAKQGLAEAQLALSTNLLAGRGCAVDAQKGMRWLTLSAKQGHAQAEYNLGKQLLEGKYYERDIEKARFWLEKAAAEEHYYAKRTQKSQKSTEKIY